MPPKIPAEFRFWCKVAKGEPDECWLWQAGTNLHGYGRISVQRRATLAHRFAYEMTFGPLPSDAQVLHKCDNPPCVNPAHLYLGDPLQNARDMVLRGRQQRVAGEDKWCAKLSQGQVDEIRKRLRHGEQGASLAREFNVHHSQIYRIKSGVQWRGP